MRAQINKTNGCISYHFYIKPQRSETRNECKTSCISYHFYIKPQHWEYYRQSVLGCISYHFYIKPQPVAEFDTTSWVVYLIISTSNHNQAKQVEIQQDVVYLIISTSNHNLETMASLILRLYILSFLHQTTTLNLLDILRKCCISYHFYIKPQRRKACKRLRHVVYLIISTSNHNDVVNV